MLISTLGAQNTFVGIRQRIPYFKVEAALSISWQAHHGLHPSSSTERTWGGHNLHSHTQQWSRTQLQSQVVWHQSTYVSTMLCNLWLSESSYFTLKSDSFAKSLELLYQHSSYNSPTSLQFLLQTSWQHPWLLHLPLLLLNQMMLNASEGKTSEYQGSSH